MQEEEKKGEKYYTIHYIKSHDFKTPFITGLIGGITINGLINANFFIDRTTLPQSLTHQVSGKKIGEEIKRDSKEGGVREVPFGILLDLTTAKHFVDWLNNQINTLEKFHNNDTASK